MANILEQSPMNPIKLRPVNTAGVSGGFPYTLPFRLDIDGILYHTKHFDSTMFVNSALPWQTRAVYAQKWQFDDEIALQYGLPLTSIIGLAIYDCHSKKVRDLDINEIKSFPGNIANGVPLNTVQYKFSFGALSLNTGRYFVVVSTIENEDVKYYCSEPQQVKNNHFGTVKIEYKHTTNRYGAFFSMNPDFCFRIEADISLDSWGYIDTEFDDQGREKFITNSELNRRYDFIVGTKVSDKIGVPKWAIDLVAESLRCDTILLDAKPFVRQPNVDPEIDAYGQLPLFSATFKMLDQFKRSNNIFGFSEIRYDFPNTYPFAIISVTMGNYMLSGNVEVNTIAEIEAIRDYGNTLGLGGSFRIEGTTLIYRNAINENYSNISAITLRAFTKFDIRNVSVGSWSGFEYIGAAAMVNFGQNGVSGNLQNMISIGNPVRVAKFYTSGSGPVTLTITLWHNDDIVYLRFLPSDFDDFSLFSLADPSPFPLALQTLYIYGNQRFKNLHNNKFTPLTKCPNLNDLLITNSLETFSSPFFTDSTALSNIKLEINSLSDTEIESFVTDLVSYFTKENGFIGLEGQTPPAPPTGPTIANLSILSNHGWTYTTD